MDISWIYPTWLVVSNSREAQTCQGSAAAHTNLGLVLFHSCPVMPRTYPMDFGMIDNGGPVDLVCRLVVFDHTHEAHLMSTLVDGKLFHFDGLLDEGFETFTMFDACMVQQFPMPKVVALPTTKVMGHAKPAWDNMFRIIDVCAGFGGLAQGAIAAGFEIAVAVDKNDKMLDLYGKISSAPKIHGDFGQKDVICKIWSLSKGARVMT